MGRTKNNMVKCDGTQNSSQKIDMKKIMEAEEIRKKFFPPHIYFVYPNRTQTISVTGGHCDMNCAHCGGHYLKNMQEIDQVNNNVSSCLISGGCNSEGKVPILDQKKKIKQLASTSRLNAHVGLVNEEEARQIGQLAEVVSFDFIASNEVIEQVYGLKDITKEDYLTSYQLLNKNVKVVPHICIGLNGGKESGEMTALEMLAEENPDALAFIIFSPTRGTFFEHRLPPSIERVMDILAFARVKFPKTPIHLGCMRPGGKYRNEVDYWAIKAGVTKIVSPSPRAKKLVSELGYKVIYREECCVL